MNVFLLLAENAENEAADTQKLILQYVIYAAIIVVGLIVLALLKRAARPPKHEELKTRLNDLLATLDGAIAEKDESTYDKIKAVTKLLTKLDKLVYVTSVMAQKERDGDLDNLSGLLESARGELATYKAVTREEDYRLSSARGKIADGISLLDKIIERDAALRKSRDAKK